VSWWKKSVIGGLILFALATLFLVIEHYRGKAGLQRWKARMERKGEVFRIEALAPPPVPPEQNGMPALIWAAAQLGGMLPNNDYPPAARYVAPGKVVAIVRDPDWIVFSGRRTTNVSWEIVGEALEQRGDALANALDAVESEHLQANLDYYRGFAMLLPHCARMKTLGQVLSASTLYQLHGGNFDEAARELEGLIRIPARWSDEHVIISHLVRIAIAHIAFGATWQALQIEGWSDEQLARVQRAWEEAGFLSGMEAAWAMERVVGTIELENFRRSNRSLDELWDVNAWAAPPPPSTAGFSFSWFMDVLGRTPELFRASVVTPIWKFAWSHQDELRYLQTVQKTLEVSRSARAGKCFVREFDQVTDDDDWVRISSKRRNRMQNFYDRIRYVFSPMMENSTKSLRRAWITETVKELAVAAIAVKRYELRHGRAPASLEALTPEFVKEVPWDYMDGKPLKYKPPGRLYSVGEDGVDDGGDAAPKEAISNYNLQNGRDLVWPEPASKEEAEAYYKRKGGQRN
jgi:hypothetical protein